MYPVSAAFLAALRGPHRAYGYVEAWRGGTQIMFDGEDGTVTGHLPLATSGSNEVSVDGATAGVRRTLTVTAAPQVGLWDKLAPIGTELHAYTVLRFPHGVTETVPQGVFVVDVQRMGHAANGDLKITAPDRWVRVQRARFLTPRQLQAETAQERITQLLLEALPLGTVVSNLTTVPIQVPAQTIDKDRAKAIEDTAKAASLDVFMGRDGNPVIRDAPAIGSSPTWTVNAGAAGVMVDADRERSRQHTYNLVVVNASRNDDIPLPPTQYVWDNDPNSPTYAGSGPGSGAEPPDPATAGPFGQVPYFYSSPLLSDTVQMVEAGYTILDRVRGLAAQVSLTAVSNPALDDGDTLAVQFPRERADKIPVVESHLIDSLTVPLMPHKSTQRIETRSTIADIDGGE